MKLSPHELFKGENSSLKKTFDEATEMSIDEMMDAQFASDYGFWRDGKYIDLTEDEALEIAKQLQENIHKK